MSMRKDAGEASIKVGTNVITAGFIGLAFANSGESLASAFIAILLGGVLIYYGIKFRDRGNE